MDGIVQLSPEIKTNTFTNAGTPLLSVIPSDAGSNKFARIKVPANGIGRISTGTRAIIRLDAYPYKEFGVVNTEVSSIAALPVKYEEGAYQYEIKLSVADTMLTSYKNRIPWQPLGLVSVDLITEDRSIFERIFQQFLDLIKNK